MTKNFRQLPPWSVRRRKRKRKSPNRPRKKLNRDWQLQPPACWPVQFSVSLDTPHRPQDRSYNSLSVAAATHMRRCCRSLSRWRRRRRNGGLTRCSRGRFGRTGAGNQHQADDRNRRTNYDCFFHNVNCFFTDNSSQVASPDVLARRILLKVEPWRVVSLTRRVCVLIPGFSA